MPPTPPPTPEPTYGPFVPTREPNLNGQYLLSQTPGADGTRTKYPAQYRDYPRGVRYFDVWSPTIKTLYSQVFWTGLPSVQLPAEVVERYKGGKAMAVVGFEMDQVRRTPDGDVSVPINIAYNHHFESKMVGHKAVLEKISLNGPDDPRVKELGLDMGHGVGDEEWHVRELAPSTGGVPTSQAFGGANGGEYRKTFHGYPPGYAQVIESPQSIGITPMQIDTWHREKMNLTGSPFVSGPAPRNSWAPTEGPGAKYSGLLECPVTTRLRKHVDGGYATIATGRCAAAIGSASECFTAAAAELAAAAHGLRQLNATADDPALPAGCSAAAGAGTIAVTFNAAAKAAECGAGSAARAGRTASLVTLNVSLDLAKQEAVISVTGPDGVWFGVGFNASEMKDAPWAVIVDGHGAVTERRLADQGPGDELAQSVTVVSSSAAAGRRTVVVSRAMRGATPAHYSFSAAEAPVLPFINAVGSGPELAHHKDKTASALALLPVAAPGAGGACVCARDPAPWGSAKGSFGYEPTTQKGEAGRPTNINFNNKCAPPPRGSLFEQRNPTCDVRTYVGGQLSCHHMFSLLDHDQDIPWPDQPLEYSLKFRFWYQDYNSSYHTNVVRGAGWDLGAGPSGVGAEYDVPKCADGVAGCSRGADGTWVHTIMGTFKGSGHPVAAHMHCHAPTCLSMATYNNKTGELICMERPVYGGTGKVDNKNMDEEGFILVPPCLWGSPEHGLEAPPDLNGVTITVVKTANATYGHHGEMAHGQIYYG